MKKGFLQVFMLLFVVLVGSAGLYYVPQIKIGNWEARRVDLLADVRTPSDDEEATEENTDNQLESSEVITEIENYSEEQTEETTETTTQTEIQISSPEEVEHHNDSAHHNAQIESPHSPADTGFSPAEHNAEKQIEETYAEETPYVGGAHFVATGLSHFRSALSSASSRPVRIAVFGDSFIEADIFTSDLRSLFQSHYGGSGVGYVDIDAITGSYRKTAKVSSTGFEKFIATKSSCDKSRQGISNRYFTSASGNASVTVSGTHGEVASFYCVPAGGMTLSAQVNGGAEERIAVSAANSVQKYDVHGNISSVKFNIKGGSPSNTYYGVAIESRHGVMVDNFSLRGSSGAPITKIPRAVMSGFAHVRPYDLIIIQFGLNIANEKQTSYTAYEKTLTNVVNTLRASYPNASFLIMGVGDRGKKDASGVHSIKGVRELAESQRKVAAATGCAFWDLYGEMKDEGGVSSLASKGYVNKDYTHITFKGGNYFARKLFNNLTNK